MTTPATTRAPSVSDEQAAELARLAEAGATLRELGERFGVSKDAVSRAIQRHRDRPVVRDNRAARPGTTATADTLAAAEQAAQQAAAEAARQRAAVDALRARQNAQQRAAADAADRDRLARYSPQQRREEWEQADAAMRRELSYPSWVRRQAAAHAQDREWRELRVAAERLGLPVPAQPPGSDLANLATAAHLVLDQAARDAVAALVKQQNRQTQGG